MRPSFFFSSQVLPHIFSINRFLASHHCSPVSPFFSLSSSFPTFENSFIQQALLSVYCTLNTKHSAGCGTWAWSQYSFYLCIQASQLSRSVMSNSLQPLSFTVSRSLLKLKSIESVMPSNSLVLYCPSLLLVLIFPSIRVFSSESALPIRWPMYRSLFQHQSFQWIFRVDFL